jgi:hypothetical protein
MVEPLLVKLQLGSSFLSQISDIGQRLGIPDRQLPDYILSPLCRLENLIKFLLERSRLGQWPIGLFLVTKDDILQYRSRHAEEQREFLVHFGTFGGNGVPLIRQL